MGGLLMPPMMGVGAFLMSDFLGVPYWDVVLRGFAISITYYVSLAFAVYLLSVRLLPREPIAAPAVATYNQTKTAIFFIAVAFLMVLMGGIGMGELRAALFTAAFMFVLLVVNFACFKYVLKDPAVGDETFLQNVRKTIETHGDMTSYLTLLLATLGIMIGLFTVTGFINRMGGMLLQLGSWHILPLIVMSFLFGWLVGMGLPPTATYIIGAVVIVGPLQELGVNPWVAHFFVFLISVWGELSPPTSLTAAISARIAEASFMQTMWEALRICLPITLMTFAIFTRSDVVVDPGWAQVASTVLLVIGCCGVAFAMFGRFLSHPAGNLALRIALAALACVALFHPDDQLVWGAAAIVLPLSVFGVWRHRRLVSANDTLESQPAT
jgi:TRAP-type uncharacterized transport system fused permease subunit